MNEREPETLSDEEIALRHGQVRIVFQLDVDGKWPPTNRERLWALPLNEGIYELVNTPFYVYGIANRDHVRAEDHGGELFFRSLVHHSGHSTLRAFIVRHEDMDSMLADLASFGCTYERAEPYDRHLFAIDVPPTADIRRTRQYLMDRTSAGLGGFEEGFVASAISEQDPD